MHGKKAESGARARSGVIFKFIKCFISGLLSSQMVLQSKGKESGVS